MGRWTRRKLALGGGLAVLVLLGCTLAAAVASEGRSHLADVTTANELTTTSTGITTTTAQTRRIVWRQPLLTLLFLPGWKFLFGDPRTHVVIRDERSDDAVFFHALPRRVEDPRTHRGVILRGDFLAWLQRHPFLRVGRIQHLRLGMFIATAVDGRVQRANQVCGESMSHYPCVPITVDPNAEGFVSFSLEPGHIFRIIKVKTPGRSVVIEIRTVKKAQPFIPAAMRLLRTLRNG
jgi:hypothetical protein